MKKSVGGTETARLYRLGVVTLWKLATPEKPTVVAPLSFHELPDTTGRTLSQRLSVDGFKTQIVAGDI